MKDSNSPKITVLMSVYNTKEEYLREAIESILLQSFTDYEFLIFDDNSDEATKKVLHSYDDKRIRIIENEVNKGLTVNLNCGLDMAQGKYIARMDADDISFPDRLICCYEYMEGNPQTNILGTYAQIGKKVEKSFSRATWEMKKALFLVTNAGPVHPSAMMRKAFLDDNGLRYDESFMKAQDYDLWARCIEMTDISIYPKALVQYRVHADQISSSRSSEQQICADRVKMRLIKRICPNMSEDQINSFISSRITGEMGYAEYIRMIKLIQRENLKFDYYDKASIEYVLNCYLFKYIKNNSKGFEYIGHMVWFMLFRRGVKFCFTSLAIGME